jgi:hypothetical protein
MTHPKNANLIERYSENTQKNQSNNNNDNRYYRDCQNN